MSLIGLGSGGKSHPAPAVGRQVKPRRKAANWLRSMSVLCVYRVCVYVCTVSMYECLCVFMCVSVCVQCRCACPPYIACS